MVGLCSVIFFHLKHFRNIFSPSALVSHWWNDRMEVRHYLACDLFPRRLLEAVWIVSAASGRLTGLRHRALQRGRASRPRSKSRPCRCWLAGRSMGLCAVGPCVALVTQEIRVYDWDLSLCELLSVCPVLLLSAGSGIAALPFIDSPKLILFLQVLTRRGTLDTPYAAEM